MSTLQGVSLFFILAALLLSRPEGATADTGTLFQSAPYRLDCADEDYRYLAAPSRRTELWDPLKYVPQTFTPLFPKGPISARRD
ncbi:hypothetical protein [Geotalea uraniireducens]|uniref:hypothetical protein n=1 Tax=Geotalea uraniireducens TaxID=351604 RepID=UPI00059E6A4C|nr:hypothetical protein [Geotalea uraniireducens]